MKALFLGLVFAGAAQAAIPTKDSTVLPFQRKAYPLKELVQDYAEALKINLSYSENLLKDNQSKVDLYLHEPTSFSDFTTLFQSILDERGFLMIRERGFYWLGHIRDVRYLPIDFYSDDSYPNDGNYVLAMSKLKYPVGSAIARNLRPFLSRYGRVIDFGDGHTILLAERADGAKNLGNSIRFMDNEQVYKNLIDAKPREVGPEEDPSNQKIVELELKNKILEKKLLEQQPMTHGRFQ